MSMAGHDVIVDHADRLHERIDYGRSAEFEAARDQLLRHRLRNLRLGRHLPGAAEVVDLRLAVYEIPQEGREASCFHDVEIDPRGFYRAFDLGAVAHDAGVAHQLLDALWRIARDPGGLEIVEGAAE